MAGSGSRPIRVLDIGCSPRLPTTSCAGIGSPPRIRKNLVNLEKSDLALLRSNFTPNKINLTLLKSHFTLDDINLTFAESEVTPDEINVTLEESEVTLDDFKSVLNLGSV
ncbi:MAG: hypothetical protein L6Q31_11775 [Fimbriimonadaceae bacterium]|nr:hypothetical protein [Fimbriimonadaceae bacterium]